MHVVECFGGGVLQSVAKLCHFTKDDFDIIVTHSRREQTPDDYARYYPDNVVFEPWHAVRNISPKDEIKSIIHLRKIVKKHKPDVLHLHSSKAGAIGRLAFPFGGGMKVIYTPRAYGFLQLNLSKKKQFIYRFLEKTLGYTKHITVACGMGEHKLAQEIARKSDVICNSISLEYLDKTAGQRKLNDNFTVVTSGRICYQKNYPLFVEIARAFEGKGVDFIWVGGEAPSDIALPKNMKVTGWVAHDESVKIMASAHIYVQTSLWEGLSLTVLEAMGLGLPVVLSGAVGNAEMIDEGKDGFICNDLSKYIKAIDSLKEDGDLRHSLGKNARAKIEKDYNNESCAVAWKKMYEG